MPLPEDLPEYTFHKRAKRYDPHNAYWLSFFSDCVYLDHEVNEEILHELGLETISWHSSGSTQCFVASNSEVIVVAFRGTEPTEFNDIATDLKAAQVEGLGGKVHTGFLGAIEEVDAEVLSCVSEQQTQGQTIWITGHSLGGALAVLCAAHLQKNNIKVNGVYTFGQPRLGDRSFCKRYNKVLGSRTFRFANVDDIVPDLPPEELNLAGARARYRNVGRPIWVTGNSELVMKYISSESAINKALSAAKAPGAHSSLGYRDVLRENLSFNPFTASVQRIRETDITSVEDLDDDTLDLLKGTGINVLEIAEAASNAKDAVTSRFDKVMDWKKSVFRR